MRGRDGAVCTVPSREEAAGEGRRGVCSTVAADEDEEEARLSESEEMLAGRRAAGRGSMLERRAAKVDMRDLKSWSWSGVFEKRARS